MSKKIIRRTRTTGAIAAAAIGTLALASCSGSDGGVGGSGDSFSLMYSASNTLESPFETLANEYMETHDGVTIELEAVPNDTYGDTLRTQLQAGNAPDVFQTEGGSGQTRSVIPLAEAGFLEPLSEASAALVPESAESFFTLDGSTYAQPLVTAFSGLILNEVALSDIGATSFPADWDEFIDLCTQASEEGKSALLVAGAAGPNTGMLAMNIAATRVYGETPDWNEQRAAGEVTFAESPGWADTMQAIVDLEASGCLQDGAVGAGFDALTNGLATGQGIGFFAPGATATELAQAAPDAELRIHAFPPATTSDPAVGILNPTYSLSINAASDAADAVEDFFAWLAEPEQANRFAEISGGLPITGLDEYDFDGGTYGPVADLIRDDAVTPLPNSGWTSPAVYEALGGGVQGLLSGQETVDSVLASLDAAWDR
ncbi:ABC transporter substrate-binding protein [Microbacterium karelineae]|uniref:ABC transporter substrate-binding protein n=1 Tax=Microbacterium karelineae TaxID=2654283 RepID=UPI0012E9C6F8|nr:extracellular solute-binding protein [Microbacterium karelineae]